MDSEGAQLPELIKAVCLPLDSRLWRWRTREENMSRQLKMSATQPAQQRTQCRRVGHDADHPHVRAQRLLHRFQRHARRNADHLKHIAGCRSRPLVHPQVNY